MILFRTKASGKRSMHMSEIPNVEQDLTPVESEPARKKFPFMIIPAILTLGAMVVLFLLTAYSSTLYYNVVQGLSSPGVGLGNYARLFLEYFEKALTNTLLVKVLMLAVCGAVSAGLCALYKSLKNPKHVLTAACLCLVPLVVPTIMQSLAVVEGIDHQSVIGLPLLFLLSEGLQTISLFCFTAGIFAYLHMQKTGEMGKSAWTGLLIAAAVWMLGNLTTNGVCPSLTNGFIGSLTFDRLICGVMVSDIGLGGAVSTLKVLLQILIGILPILFLRRHTPDHAMEQSSLRGEFWLLPAAGLGIALALFVPSITVNLKDAPDFTVAGINSIILTLAAGTIGVLIAWSLIRLLSRTSILLFAVISLILAAALSCPLFEYLAFRRFLDALLPQAILAVFDWRMVVVIITIGFLLRNHQVNRPVFLIIALGLLVAAFSWSDVYHALIYGTHTGNHVLPYGYYAMLANLNVYDQAGLPVSVLKQTYWYIALLIYIVPLLLGLGAALLTRKAFQEEAK